MSRYGHKQIKLINIIRGKGYIDQTDIEDIYNLRRYDLVVNKFKELVAMGWIKHHPDPNINKFLIGEDLPFIEDLQND